MNDLPFPLLPAPAHFEPLSGHFDIDAAVVIVLRADASQATLRTARNLQQAIEKQAGVQLLIGPAAASARAIALRIDSGSGAAESYRLQISGDRIELAAPDEAGLFYGAQTLIQLLRGGGRSIAACRCEDRPALPNRGIMLDVSRGKVPTLRTLERLVDGLAHYKLNQLQLYTEHTFHFASHPDIGAGCDPLTADDMYALDAYCSERHVQLVPNLQSTGHMRHILDLPQYQHLAETPWHWSISAAGDEPYRFIDQLYGDFLPAFRSRLFNIDSDETYDFGRGQTSAKAAELGVGRLYLNHIVRLRELAARHGRTVMMWADILHHHPELIAEVPDDIVLLDWSYEAAPRYPTLDAIAAAGRPFYVCPGTSTWNTLFPRLDNAIGNIRTYVTQGLELGARGMLLTDWGDMGHYQPYANSWYPYLFGAEMAWAGGRTSEQDFDRAFGVLFLGQASGQAVQAMRRLGSAVQAPGIGVGNGSLSAYALWEDPLAGKTRSASRASLNELRDAAAHALRAWAVLPEPELRHALQFDALLLRTVADKVLAGRAAVDALKASGQTSAGELAAAIDALAANRARLQALQHEWERLWLQEARRGEIGITLAHYAGLEQRWTAALAWLREQHRRLVAGEAVDRELSSYDTGEYAVLWEQGGNDLRRLVGLVGRDKVPAQMLEWLGM